MKDFIYYVPTKFIKEIDAEEKIGPELHGSGIGRVLIVSSGDKFEEHLITEIEGNLKASNIYYTGLQGVCPNPHLSLVYKGIRLCREEHLEFILAVGGGSVIDTAKTIAAGVCYDGDVWDFFEKKAVIESALPIGAVLTYPATGSESSNVAVINHVDLHKKLLISSSWLIPKYAFLNPVLTFTLPEKMTARGITDIFSHICERYFCEEKQIGVVDRMAEAALRTIVAIGANCLKQPENYELRSELMWLGSVAQNNFLGIGRTQDWCVHALGNELSAVYDCVHGDTLSVMMIPWMRYVFHNDVERFARYGRTVFGISGSLPPEEQAKRGIEETERFLKSLHMPMTLREIAGEISSGDIEKMVKQIPLRRDGTTGAARKLNRNDLKAIYKSAV